MAVENPLEYPDGTPADQFDRFIGRRFGMVVMQPTTQCPWECDYCYLSTRHQRLEMTPAIAEAVARSIRLQGVPGDGAAPGPGGVVDIVWHGGEPLALGPERFARLLAPFEALLAEGRIRHHVQTSGSVITPRWCELFTRHRFAVGVSVDGPDWADARRHDRAGRPTHARTMRGIRRLRDSGIPFTAIAVVTPESVDRADEIAVFFEELGAYSVGFNIEEYEGANTERPAIGREQVARFWRTLFERRSSGSTLRIREVDHILSYLRHTREGAARAPGLIDPIPTVAWNGDVVLLSPELAGTHAPGYDDFVVGNVTREALPEILRNAHVPRYVSEFVQSLRSCAGACEFYSFCGGAQAGNRYFEHGTFTRSETAYCINTKQTLVTALHEFTAEKTEGRT